jgi:hypothetical protein
LARGELFDPHNGRHDDLSAIIEANVNDLLIAADPLGREAFGDQHIQAPAHFVKLFVFAPDNQTVPIAPVFFSAVKMPA